MEFNPIYSFIATHVDEFTIGVMLGDYTFRAGEGGVGRSIFIDAANGSGGTVLFSLDDGTGGPGTTNNVGSLGILIGT